MGPSPKGPSLVFSWPLRRRKRVSSNTRSSDYKMHGPHRLRCQHAWNADVATVSRVISGSFGSPALTAPSTDSLPPALSMDDPADAGRAHTLLRTGLTCKARWPGDRRVPRVVAPRGCVARVVERAGPVLPSDQGGASDGPGLCRCGRPLRLEGGRGPGPAHAPVSRFRRGASGGCPSGSQPTGSRSAGSTSARVRSGRRRTSRSPWRHCPACSAASGYTSLHWRRCGARSC